MTRLSITLRRFIRPLIGSLAILITFALLFISSRTTTSVQANDEVSTPRTESITATFPADAPSLGAIPDAPAAGCGQYGTTTPKDVTYTVSGLTGTITDVRVSSTFSPQHTWGGDLWLELRSPGNTVMKTIFKNRGSTTATGCGSSNALAGPYNFFDTAAATNFNTVAGTPTPAGDYQANTPCGVAGCGTATPITPSFTGLANPNGTWTLRILDGGGGDTGTISASTLTITTGGGAPMQHVVDYDGDGKTDYSVVRNTGGGSGGQTTWFNKQNGAGAPQGFAWGISTDFFVPSDFDGDSKTDIAVWRPGIATQAAFYILQSQTNTLRTVIFGQTGDDPTVVGDYDGDGKADPAVYRTGAQSIWFYLGSMNNPGNNITYNPWGQTGDFPAPGDYDGDGKNDFVMQRNDGGGNARFWIRYATGTIDNSIVFGTPTDLIVPGDYDGDRKTDIAVVRADGSGNILWFIRRSSNGTTVGGPFGASAIDFITQGDYDGDGKTDLAVWRPATGIFYSLNSGNGMVNTFQWGASGDFPVASYNAH